MTEKKEAVNHPLHYNGDSDYECIKVLETWLAPGREITPETAFRAILGNPRVSGGLDYRLARLVVYEPYIEPGIEGCGNPLQLFIGYFIAIYIM